MRPMRILIEVGNPAPASDLAPQHVQAQAPVAVPAAPVPEKPLGRDKLWAKLVESRTKMLATVENGNSFDVDRINLWIGGAVAALSILTNEKAEDILERLAEEVPAPTSSVNAPSRASFIKVDRERPKPPPGAPRDVDPHNLPPEEREKLGIVLPEEMDELLAEDPAGDPDRAEESTG